MQAHFIDAIPALSISELQNIAISIKKEIDKRKKNSVKECKAALQDVAKQYGFSSLDEVLVNAPKVAKKAEIKYRNSDDPEKTWTGRGKKPNWLVNALKEGYNLTDFEVAK